MSQVDYAAMSYIDLRRHFLKHREDQAAFQAYLAGVESDLLLTADRSPN